MGIIFDFLKYKLDNIFYQKHPQSWKSISLIAQKAT